MPSKKTDNQTIIWIVVAVILLIAIGVTLYFILRHKKESYIPPHSEENYEEVTKLNHETVHHIAHKIAQEKKEVKENIQKAVDYIQMHVGTAIEVASKFITSAHTVIVQSRITENPTDNHSHTVHKTHEQKQEELLKHLKEIANRLKLGDHYDTKDILSNISNVEKFVEKVHKAFEVHGKKGDFISLAHSLHDDFNDDLKGKISDVEEKLNKIHEKNETIKKQELQISTGAPHEVSVLKEKLAKKEENTKKFLDQLKKISKEDISKEELQKLIEEAAKKNLEAHKHVATEVAKHLSKDDNLEKYVNGISNLEDFLPELFIENYLFDNINFTGKNAIDKIVNAVEAATIEMYGYEENYENISEEHAKNKKELDIKCIETHLKKIIKKCHKEVKKEKDEERKTYEKENTSKENYEEDDEDITKPPSKEERARGKKFIESLENIMGKEKIENLRKILGHHINNKHILRIITEISEDKKMREAVKFILEHQESEHAKNKN